jgi:DNA-binding XRE family transcriptional regulator
MRYELGEGNGPAIFAGLTQRAIAEAIGVTQSTVCKWLAGTYQPKMEFALRLADLRDEIDHISGKSQRRNR